MKKQTTKRSHFEQINLALAYINSHYNTHISVDELAKISGYSIFHFHRIFKDITGESVNEYIKNTRLEKSSNLLVYNQHKTIDDISSQVGFSTATGFSSAFKKRFSMSPKEWRNGGYALNPLNIDNKYSTLDIDDSIIINEPKIVNREILPILYMRVYGYEDDMSSVWNRLFDWCEFNDVLKKEHRFFGVFHNHPSFIPYDKARYLACVEVKGDVYRSGEVGRCRILDGKFARFEFRCTTLELYKMIHHAYIKWLPDSGYELRNFPSYVEYKNPKALLENGVLDIDFYMPISYL
jgi:AraC family transcriptional regulator